MITIKMQALEPVFDLDMFQDSCFVCSSDLADEILPALPVVYNEGLTTLKRGYTGFGFKKCDVPFADIEDIAEWNTKIQSGDMGIIMDCSITGGHGETFNERQEGCEEYTIREDYKTAAVFNIFKDTPQRARWEFIKKAREGRLKGSYDVVLIECDGTILVSKDDTFINPDSFLGEFTKGASKSETSQYTVTITMDSNNYKPLDVTWNAKDLVINPTTP